MDSPTIYVALYDEDAPGWADIAIFDTEIEALRFANGTKRTVARVVLPCKDLKLEMVKVAMAS